MARKTYFNATSIAGTFQDATAAPKMPESDNQFPISHDRSESNERGAKRTRIRRLRQYTNRKQFEEASEEEEYTEVASVQGIYHERQNLIKDAENGRLDWGSDEVKVRVTSLLHGCESEPDTLLHHLVLEHQRFISEYQISNNTTSTSNLNTGSNGKVENESGHSHLEILAAYALELDPGVLMEPAYKTKKTALQWAIERGAVERGGDRFAKHLCEVASELPGSSDDMNACEEAIHFNKNGQTCLHFAISTRLNISRFLVSMASVKTLLLGSGPKGNTPLHEAVDFKHLGYNKWWPKLVEAIVDMEPKTMFQANIDGHSPYRYHLISAGKHNWKTGTIQTDSSSTTQVKALIDHEISGTNQLISFHNAKEEATEEHHDLRPNLPFRPQPDGNVKPLSPQQIDMQTEQADYIQEFLELECLEFGNHQDAFKGLWGSFDGNPRTWINLLNVELDALLFKKKLQFRRLDKRLGFVGLKVPIGTNSIHNRDRPIKDHLIVEFFRWLKNVQRVEEILKVVIQDDENSPCSDDVIKESLRGFNVRYLDWDREDLYILAVDEVMKDARGIHLYWGGNDAILRGWANDLEAFPNLKEVQLTVLEQKWDSTQRTKANIDEFKEVMMKGYDPPILVTGGEIPKTSGRRNRDLGGGQNHNEPIQSTTHHWFTKINAFTEGMGDFSEEQKSLLVPVKVAIIDDGVDPYGPYNIADGISYSQPRNPFNAPPEPFPSTRGHGTAMAKIFHRVCPLAKLYIAKLNEPGGRRKFSMKYAAKAIQWAVNNQVHIISMSWTIDGAPPEDIAALKTAIENAERDKIIMFCAARDEGKDDAARQVYPYSCAPQDSIIRIGATDQFGTLRPYVPREIDFSLPGVGLANLSNEQTDSGEGSSEATAVGAGLAALVLVCFSASSGEQGINYVKGNSRMRKLFHFFANKQGGYVHPGLFQTAAVNAKPKTDDEKRGDTQEDEIKRRMKLLEEFCRGILGTPDAKPQVNGQK